MTPWGRKRKRSEVRCEVREGRERKGGRDEARKRKEGGRKMETRTMQLEKEINWELGEEGREGQRGGRRGKREWEPIITLQKHIHQYICIIRTTLDNSRT